MSSGSWLSIRQKLYVLGFVCLVGASVLAVTAIVFSNRVAESARVIDQERFAPLSRLQDLSSQLKEVRFRLAGVLLDQMPIPGSRNHLGDTVKAAPVLVDGAVDDHLVTSEPTRDTSQSCSRPRPSPTFSRLASGSAGTSTPAHAGTTHRSTGWWARRYG